MAAIMVVDTMPAVTEVPSPIIRCSIAFMGSTDLTAIIDPTATILITGITVPIGSVIMGTITIDTISIGPTTTHTGVSGAVATTTIRPMRLRPIRFTQPPLQRRRRCTAARPR